VSPTKTLTVAELRKLARDNGITHVRPRRGGRQISISRATQNDLLAALKARRIDIPGYEAPPTVAAEIRRVVVLRGEGCGGMPHIITFRRSGDSEVSIQDSDHDDDERFLVEMDDLKQAMVLLEAEEPGDVGSVNVTSDRSLPLTPTATTTATRNGHRPYLDAFRDEDEDDDDE
jgi:hypothetical protein